MTFDAIQASALRAAIDKTVSTLGLHSAGWGTHAEGARPSLLNHLNYLLEQERLLFTHVVVLPETKTHPVADTPWYPDDSGEWVEVPDDLMSVPPELDADNKVKVLCKEDREDRNCNFGVTYAGEFRWDIAPTEGHRIVAYKVVKP